MFKLKTTSISGSRLMILAVTAILLSACAAQTQTTSQPASQPVEQTNSNSPVVSTSTLAPSDNPTTEAATPVPTAGSDQTEATTGEVSFSSDIVPLFQTSCINCHGGEKTSKGLDMKTFASLMAGSQNGAVIVPGNSATSKIIQSVQSGKMPKKGPKLTSDQIQLLVDWINSGALNN